MAFIEQDNCLTKKFEFKDFVEAMSFMTEVAFYCEKLNHHPNWENVYNSVTVKLNTHDAGNVVTEKDHQLARIILQVYERYSSSINS